MTVATSPIALRDTGGDEAPRLAREYLSGVEALVRLPIEQIRRDRAAGLRSKGYVTGYPGSPLGGYDLALNRAPLKQYDILHVPGQNEELAATSLMGTQMLDKFEHDDVDGVIGFWYGKGPGVDRSGDAIKHGNFGGTSEHGAVVILSGEDHEAKSSSVPYQQEFSFEHAGVPVLFPSTVSEFLDYGLHAIALSRYSGCWTALKLVAPLCDGGEVVDFEKLVAPVIPAAFEIEGKPFKKSTDFNFFPVLNVAIEAKLYNERHEAVLAYARANHLNKVTLSAAGDRIAIIAAGKSYTDTRQALEDLGFDAAALAAAGIRLAKVGLLCPTDEGFFREFCAGVDLIVVVEEKRDFLERQVAKSVLGHTGARIVGKKDIDGRRLFPVEGGMDVDIVAGGLARVLKQHLTIPESGRARLAVIERAKAPAPPLFANRTPNYCSGCPHNVSTKLGEGQIAWGAPGCHVFAAVMEQPERRIEGMTQLGGEGLPWIGLSPYTTKKHMVQNLGDGALYHSSHQNIRFAVSTGQTMTFRILYNGVIANTGGQGYASDNSVLSLCKQLDLYGVKQIILATKEPKNYRGKGLPSKVSLRAPHEVPQSMTELSKVDGVTVLIYDGACANERRRREKRGKTPKPTKFTIVNEDVCENCGDCGRKANCMSLQKVETEFGLKTRIHQSSCNHDQACVEGECPSFITILTEEGGEPAKIVPPEFPQTFSEPRRPDFDGPFSIYIPGVGGTGVITINAILARAALLDGLEVKTFDQTGAAQKWGAVLSSLIVARAGEEIISNKVTVRNADLYLALDMVAGGEGANLAVCDRERTRVAVNSNTLPTGEKIRNINFQLDEIGMVRHIAAQANEKAFVSAPALTIAERLFGNYILSNVVMIGVAYQAGYLPISAEAIEGAIGQSGNASKLNILAFRAGRLSVSQPERMDALLSRGEVVIADRTYQKETRASAAVLSMADRLVMGLPNLTTPTRVRLHKRLIDLIDYQNSAYATRYANQIRIVSDAEARATGNGDGSLTRAAVTNLHKIMAYKDEYEVARLLTDSIFEQRMKQSFPTMVSYSYNLQPPVARGFGLDRKIELGKWFRPALVLLKHLKVLRGTPIDIFGYNAARRAERSAVSWYIDLLTKVASHVSAKNLEVCEKLLRLPEDIRGYELLKVSSLSRAQESAKRLVALL